MEDLILVDLFDTPQGRAEKLEVHRRGLLHRAFSVFLLGSQGMLLQQRAQGKYHSGGLWANTCCSHPRWGEDLAEAARRRLQEEAGIDCAIQEAFSFLYRCRFANGLIEYEYDHVFIGHYEGAFQPNPQEAAAMRWFGLNELAQALQQQPERFAHWFITAAPQVIRLERQQSRE